MKLAKQNMTCLDYDLPIKALAYIAFNGNEGAVITRSNKHWIE